MTTSKVCRYNKLNFHRIHKTWELFWHHSTSIIKLWPLGTSISLGGTFFSNTTSPHKVLLRKTYAFSQLRQGWGPSLNQGFNQARGRLAYQILPFLRSYYLSIRSLSAELMPSPELRWFYDTFRTKPTDKDFYQTWGPTSPEILRCYVVKAPYVPEVIGTELKQPTEKKNVTTRV